MKRLLLITACLTLLLSGCDKETTYPSNLLATWQPQEHSFLVTLTRDYSFVSLFGNPWKGEVRVNGNLVDFSDNRFIIDNSLGDKRLYGKSINFTFYSNAVAIVQNEKSYVLTSGFSVDLAKGTFTAKGTATSKTESIEVDVSLSAPTVSIKKGVEYPIVDAMFFTKAPIQKITFTSNGKIRGSLMDIDVCTDFTGSYSTNGETLNLSYNVFTKNVSYSYTYEVKDNHLVLTRPIDYSTYDIYATIPKEIIASLRYQISMAQLPNE
ncbi:hypothetical protein [uncultured Acetobacteroides sp.]|uniref:hypothetical protein n=1 Tax=uncultured Acetobacteroides sp. TaxID=1760811 RepID=UPI0029F5A415|nr:hypothetical protein [uncultured Acetobacteroides sp.]